MLGATIGRAASAAAAPVTGGVSTVATQTVAGGLCSVATPNYATRPINIK